MCGIIGYTGKENAKDILIEGLKALEYRGYDSSGIAYVFSDHINIIKSEGRIANLEKIIPHDIKPHIGIGHTRWATHGKPNKVNAHPHHVGLTTIVHNGIIENYQELKKDLASKYQFKSETDTEVLCALIDYYYQKLHNKEQALLEVMKIVKGSYAVLMMFDDELNSIYAMRKDSPLILAQKDNNFFIASDIAAILKYTNEYYLLNEGEIAKINDNNLIILNSNLKEIKKDKNIYKGTSIDVMKNGYKHFMLKEIDEEINVYQNIINSYLPNYDILELKKNFGDFTKYEAIEIVACGSAYHAGLVSKSIFEELVGIPTTVEMASEYRYKKIFANPKKLVILISQSGETADTLEALRIANTLSMDTLGIINVISSSIARECKHVIYSLAGCEIAVATTKAYLSQVLILILLAILMAYEKKLLSQDESNKLLLNLKEVIDNTKEILKQKDEYKKIAKKLEKEREMFFIGREIDYALCMEASLKMKEISYIHSEAYPAGELKHGTISLIEDGTYVFGIITNPKIAYKTISNLKETKARGAKVILVTTIDLFKQIINDNFYEDVIIVKKTENLWQSLTIITPLQLLAYYTALYKKEDIDKPRNLAKSVTVE